MMRKVLLILLALLMVLPLSVIPAGASAVSTNAADFDKIPVETDLAGTTIGGVKWDPTRYGYDKKGDLQVITLMEYGYPNDPALYLYLYNPQDIALNTRDRRYAVTLAMGDETKDYEKCTLKVLSTYGTEAHSRLWVKCRIDVKEETIAAAFEEQTSRTYRLGEIELVVGGEVKAFPVGGAWTYQGSTTAGDLISTFKQISVIELELKPLVYRGDAMIKEFYVYDQINSVCFSISKNFEEQYGEIKSILCTWTEYDSGWILGCKTDDVYNMLTDRGAVGKQLTDHDKSFPSIHCEIPGFCTIFSWNPWPYSSTDALYFTDTLQWLVKYDGSKAEYGALLETDLQKQMEAQWDAYRKAGATNYFSAGGEEKTVDILSDENFTVRVDDGSNWWQKIFSKNYGVTSTTQEAFQKVTEESLDDPETLLLVDESYKEALTKDLYKAESEDKDLIVLHFASCDYYSIPVTGVGNIGDSDTWVNDGKEDMYACREQVYMGFDIIQFTCEKDGETVVVPVAAAPINVIGDLQFFGKVKELPDWLKILLVVAAIIILLVLLPIVGPVLVPLLKGLVWLVLLPFKLLWWLLKALGRGIGALFRKRE